MSEPSALDAGEAIPASRPLWIDAARALRPHQWVKNLLLLVPAIMAHRMFEPGLLKVSGIAFVAFSLCASAMYVSNDLFDLEADRAHRSKRNRPFAAGRLAPRTGWWMAAALAAAGLAIGLAALPLAFVASLAGYLLLATGYSVFLKRIVIADVITLGLLFTLRVFAGGLAGVVEVSFWCAAFSLFFFTGLAFAKRHAELLQAGNAPGRDYTVSDLSVIRAIGPASGLVAVLIVCLYINTPRVLLLYQRPEALWAICPVLLWWIARIWILAERRFLEDDPVVFAVKDPASYVACVLVAASLAAAKVLP